MSDEAAGDNFEGMVRRALAPVDPPEDLAQRLETTLWNLTELAVDELEGWELRSMRDPRNWVGPAPPRPRARRAAARPRAPRAAAAAPASPLAAAPPPPPRGAPGPGRGCRGLIV